jgi:glutamyl-tRNA synthetase
VSDGGVRTRFAPAPSGEIHVGNVRTALFAWAVARKAGGTFLLRVEDTDRSRVLDEYVAAVQTDLAWIGLDWDEGPGIGGPHAPYRQSERLDIYAEAVETLLDSGAAYRAFDTQEELAEQRAKQAENKQAPRYDGSKWKALSRSESDELAASGKSFVIRFAMPTGHTVFTDLVRGEVKVDNAELPDFALTRADGHPLYYLAATVDDVRMGLTHIVRGEDLLMATPRQMAMYTALGYPQDRWPAFAHLPLIVGADSKPLSKRNGEVSLSWYRREGFLPEAVMNYLGQLGWSMGNDQELFTAAEFVEAFSLDRVQRNTARFDLKKLEALNGEWVRRLDPADLRARVAALLHDAGIAFDDGLLDAALPELTTRIKRMTDVVQLLAPVFQAPGSGVEIDPEAAAILTGDVEVPLQACVDGLGAVGDWTPDTILEVVKARLVDGLGLKPRVAFGPLYVAMTGRRSGLPVNHVMALVGQDETLRRLADALERVRGGA